MANELMPRADTSPVVTEFNKDKGDAQATAAATPPKAAPETKDNVVQFPQPKTEESGFDLLIKGIAELEKN